MGKIARAQALRDETSIHYNCCQAVLIPFAGDCGLDEESAARLTANFGSGMRHGATCGAVTGALMVLGLMGKGEAETKALLDGFRAESTYLNCAELLEKMRSDGLEKKPHCDGRVRDAVALLEEILKD